MGLPTKLVLLPIKGPLDGTMWLMPKAAEQELNDPCALRKLLKLLDIALVAGRITEEECAAAEEDILGRLKGAG